MCFLHQYSISFLAISHAIDDAHSARSDVHISVLITFLSTLINFRMFYFFILITYATCSIPYRLIILYSSGLGYTAKSLRVERKDDRF
jgi:hypothetical protein